jgi:hypothetical protein
MTLLNQLRLYGLNPKEWSLSLKYIKPNCPMIATLKHKEIENFKLEGLCLLNGNQFQLEFSGLSLHLSDF